MSGVVDAVQVDLRPTAEPYRWMEISDQLIERSPKDGRLLEIIVSDLKQDLRLRDDERYVLRVTMIRR